MKGWRRGMPDRGMVVKCYEFCLLENKCSTDCPYWDNKATADECTEELAKDVLTLLKEQEVKELTTEEWQTWKKDKKHDPICLLWEYDSTPIWILDANDIHEPALLMGKCKLFKGKPTHEQCKAVKWE